MKIYIQGLNPCVLRKTNIERIREAARNAGHEIVHSVDDCNLIILWTCSFRQDVHDNSLDVLQKYIEQDKQVIVTGCLPSIDPDGLKHIFSGKIIEWKNFETEFPEELNMNLKETKRFFAERALPIPIEEFKQKNPKIKAIHGDQFIKLFISEGCNLNCAYCAEKQAFPPYNSIPIDSLVEKTKDIIEKTGEYRVALHGDSPGAYGSDIDTTFGELLSALVSEIPQIKLAIKNLHPIYWKTYFNTIDQLLDSQHIFLIEAPVQSANNRILTLMERNYTLNDLQFLFGSLKNKPNIETETHIIAGFPSETDAEFEDTVNFLVEYSPKYVMASAFMSVKGMKASQFDNQISMKEKQKRLIYAHTTLTKHGIICTYDLDTSIKDTFQHSLIYQLE